MKNNYRELLRELTGRHASFRVLAFGSSNTGRRLCGMHWLDYFELGLKRHHRASCYCINTGIGGNTTRDLIRRFESDAVLYKPHMVFITIGGNDANPVKELGAVEYRDNLLKLIKDFTTMGTVPVLQTYYAHDALLMNKVHAAEFEKRMEIIRDVAQEKNLALVDHYAFWEPLREKKYEDYRALMIEKDGVHVNRIGNGVMGLYLSDLFGVPPFKNVEVNNYMLEHDLEYIKKIQDFYTIIQGLQHTSL